MITEFRFILSGEKTCLSEPKSFKDLRDDFNPSAIRKLKDLYSSVEFIEIYPAISLKKLSLRRKLVRH